MKTTITIIITTIVAMVIAGSAVYFYQVNTDPRLAISQETTEQALKTLQFTCEASGGTFIDDTCDCPIEEQLNQTQEMMYQTSTGYCLTTVGGPGGSVADTANTVIGLRLELSNLQEQLLEAQGEMELSGSFHYNADEAREGAETAAHLVAGTVCITPENSDVNNQETFCLNKTDGMIENFGIDLSTGCDKYYGNVTIVVKNLEDFDYDGIDYADLVEIIEIDESANCAQ